MYPLPKYCVNRLFRFLFTFAPVFSQSEALLGYHGNQGKKITVLHNKPSWAMVYRTHRLIFEKSCKTLSSQGRLCLNRPLKGTRGFLKTFRVCHVYCNFKIGFTCRIAVIFGTLKDGSLLINTLASNICFSYGNMFQNGVDALSKNS